MISNEPLSSIILRSVYVSVRTHSYFWLCVRIWKKIGKNSKSPKFFFLRTLKNSKKSQVSFENLKKKLMGNIILRK